MDLLQIEAGEKKKAYGSGSARLPGEWVINNQGCRLQNDSEGNQSSLMGPIYFLLLNGGNEPSGLESRW